MVCIIFACQVQWNMNSYYVGLSQNHIQTAKIPDTLSPCSWRIIKKYIHSESTGGSQAESICKSSITTRAPFGKWTDDMVAMLGDSQVVEFTFYYGTP